MGWDKTASISKLWRTPEQTFFLLALLGGFPGLFAARRLFNHKTTKQSFVTTMWILFALQVGAVTFYLHQTGLEVIGLEKKTSTQGLPSETDALQ